MAVHKRKTGRAFGLKTSTAARARRTTGSKRRLRTKI